MIEEDRRVIEQRVTRLLEGPFRLLGAFVKNHGCSASGELVLDVQGAGFDQFYARAELNQAPDDAALVEGLRSFLREVEAAVSKKLRGVVWDPGDPPVGVGETVRLICDGCGEVRCLVVAVDKDADQITLERQG